MSNKVSLIPGRFQSFHEGHKALIDAVIAEGKRPCIGIMDTDWDEANPLDFNERADAIMAIYGDTVDIVRLPRIEEICFGRNVGYAMRRVFHEKEYIAASDIRTGKKSEPNPLDDPEFLRSYRRVAQRQYDILASKGFWDQDVAHIGLLIAKAHSELSEALECFRLGNPPDKNVKKYSGGEVQLSDVLGILMGIEIGKGLKISEALLHKQQFNKGRPWMHGNKEF